MLNKRTRKSEAYKAWPIAVELARNNETINGDLVFDALLANGYPEEVIYKYSGPLIKILQAESLIKKTDTCTVSKRNRSSLQRQWQSTIYKK